ncbi:MAG TPA: glycosyltransferase [Desulfonatronum sp.]|nr:glycosyltransferase [Desulfonatronum sp.]
MNISIVTPTWNRAAMLRSCLDSVKSQNTPPCEHIIVDNLSTDETTGVIKDYADSVSYPVHHVREKDSGIYQAMNKGVHRVSGDALHFLNDDDMLCDENVLLIMGQCLSRYHVDIAFGDVILLSGAPLAHNYRRHRQVNRLTLVERTITQQALFYRRSVFDRCGVFDAHLRIAADHEWLLRAFLLHNISAAYVKRPVALFRTGGVSNDMQTREAHRLEREKVTAQYFTQREIRAARLYRGVFRKIPFGATMLGLLIPLRLDVKNLRVGRQRFLPDPTAWFDL